MTLMVGGDQAPGLKSSGRSQSKLATHVELFAGEGAGDQADLKVPDLDVFHPDDRWLAEQGVPPLRVLSHLRGYLAEHVGGLPDVVLDRNGDVHYDPGPVLGEVGDLPQGAVGNE